MRLDSSLLDSAIEGLTFQRDTLMRSLNEKIQMLKEARGSRRGRKARAGMDALVAAAAEESNGPGKRRGRKARAAKRGGPEFDGNVVLAEALNFMGRKHPLSVPEIAEGIKPKFPGADQHWRWSVVVMHALRGGAKRKMVKKVRGKWQRIAGAKLPAPETAQTAGAGAEA